MAKKGAGALVVTVAGEPRDVTGSSDPRVANRLVTQLAGTLWLPEDVTEEERVERISAAIAALRGIAPRDQMEGMLGMQMVTIHAAAMECLARAAQGDEGTAGRRLWLRKAVPLLALYARQTAALDRIRGKGRTVVEHVRVEPGGPAILGPDPRNVPDPRTGQAARRGAGDP